MSSVLFGIGTIGIVAIQAVACLSVVVYFRRDSSFHWWKSGLAPALGLPELSGAVVLIISEFSFVSGKDNPWVGALPYLLLVVDDRRRRIQVCDCTASTPLVTPSSASADDSIDADAWDDTTERSAVPRALHRVIRTWPGPDEPLLLPPLPLRYRGGGNGGRQWLPAPSNSAPPGTWLPAVP